ncbi:hypothetical protein P152DRAFT_381078, partial [Eremomyces bilateralis CBS 781.70]
MPTINIHPRPRDAQSDVPNPLPELLHTPTGLAILELQSSFAFPPRPSASNKRLGRLAFPLYDPSKPVDAQDASWMKKVWLYVGKHQRVAGEVKKLEKPLGVVRRREGSGEDGEGDDAVEELEVMEIVKWKIVFSNRPEPV